MNAGEVLMVLSTDTRSCNLSDLEAGILKAIVEKPGLSPES